MPADHRELAFEVIIEDHLVEHGGYRRLDPAAFDRGIALWPEETLQFIQATQPEAWARLTDLYKAEAPELFLKELARALETRGSLDVLRHGLRTAGTTLRLAHFRPASGLNPETQRLYAGNRLGVARQVRYATDSESSLDLVLAVNGIPVVTAELKNQLTGQDVKDAIRQYREDRDARVPLLQFKRGALVHFAVDPLVAEMTTRLEGSKTKFLPFNRGRGDGAGNPDNAAGHRTGYLWEEVWQRDALLDILQRFLHLEVEEVKAEDGSGRKAVKERLIFPRYHQLDAVTRLVKAARDEGPGHTYLVQHSAGSGKSNTIAWLTHRLSSLHGKDDAPVFDSVIVITDRTVLDQQLQSTIYQFEHAQGVVARVDPKKAESKSKQLADYLQGKKRIIIVTLQTFPYVLEHLANLQERKYAIVVDEAHSSQTGETAKEMKAVLSGVNINDTDDWEDLLAKSAAARGRRKNLSFFAFTATPKGKTLEVFGRTPHGGGKPQAFHLYTMRQAIEEGFILDVLQHYTTYKAYYKLVKAIDEDPRFPKRAAAVAVKRFLELHPHNIAQKVAIIVEHFRAHTKHKIGGRAKAMIVTGSREHAVRYKLAIDAYLREHRIKDIKALVAFTGTITVDGLEHTEPRMNNGVSESQLPKVFNTPEYQVLIVAEKYQTGFDQPLLHTMYVDKKLSGVHAVQTLSRLNRIHPGKEDTFVLDFQNDRQEILDSFQPFYEATHLAEPSDPQHLYQLENELNGANVYWAAEVEAFCKAYFDPRRSGTEKAHAELYRFLTPSVDRFNTLEEERREDFREKLRAFLKLYQFQAQVVNYHDTQLEKGYTFGRFLYKVLPARPAASRVEFEDELALQYYRLQKLQEGAIQLEPGTGGTVQPPRATGTRKAEDEEVELSQLIERLNDALGTDFTEADRLFFEQIEEDALGNDAITQAAVANTEENFALQFDAALLDLFLSRDDRNDDMLKRFLGDDRFRDLVTIALRKAVYRKSRERAGTQA